MIRKCLIAVLMAVAVVSFVSLISVSKSKYELERKLAQVEVSVYFHEINLGILSDSLMQVSGEMEALNKVLETNRNNFSLMVSRYFDAQLVTATSYSPRVQETDDTPFIAASGDSVGDYTIAVSRDFLRDGWRYGDLVYIQEFDRIYKVNDTMNARFSRRIDVFNWVTADAIKFGKKSLTIYRITS